MAASTNRVHVCDHPALAHKLTQFRSTGTNSHNFRLLLKELTFCLGYEATRDLKTSQIKVKTPVDSAEGPSLSSKIALVPIMRSGLGMVDSMLDLLPFAQVHHLGMYREVGSLCPVLYYNRLPGECTADVAVVLEPLIATAGTINATLGIIKDWGVKSIKVLTIVASKEGLEALHAEHPDVHVYVGAADDKLTDSGLVSPGVGDVGDRMWNTSANREEVQHSNPTTGGIRMSPAGNAKAEQNEAKRQRTD